MKVIKVDGTVFVGEINDGVVTNALAVTLKGLTEVIGKANVRKYVTTKHLGKLLTMTVGTHSAVATRDLFPEEVAAFNTANAEFEIAEAEALKQVVVDYFEGNF